MKLSHTLGAISSVFDEPNLVSSAGLVPAAALAESAGLIGLAGEHLTVPSDKGANAGLKVASLVAGMATGGDSIDDMALLRHGGMGRVFDHAYAPSTLGSFLRSFAFGHVRQLDAVASRFLARLADQAPVTSGVDELAILDVDDTVVEVHGYAKQGAGFGYNQVRGLNALIATVSTPEAAPVVVAQRLRKGSANSARGAQRLVRDALKTVRGLASGSPSRSTSGRVLMRADSAYYGHAVVGAALRAGAEVSVTVRMDAKVKAAIAAIDEDAWTTIAYPNAVFDEPTGRWISRAEVAEIDFTAFTSKKQADQVPGRLVVRRIPDLNTQPGQGTLFEQWRHHAFFTTTPREVADSVAADKTHRGHAIIEQVHADLKGSALAHLPSGKFNANAAWLVLAVMAFNLTRTAGTLGGPELARASTGTIRRKLINVPARVATSARRLTLHLPQAWPWEPAWTQLLDRVADPPPTLAA
ncbi:MAG: IS1380 family transposase [Pseudonocardia sp.]